MDELIAIGPQIQGYTIQYCLNPSHARSMGGAVYLALNENQEKVIIKLAMQEKAISLLMNEHEILKYLQDEDAAPQLIQVGSGIFNPSEDDVWVAGVLEYIDGALLKDTFQVAHITSFDHKQVAVWLLAVAHAVKALHDKGLCHGDLKPDNIILTPSGKAVLIDFEYASLVHTQPSFKKAQLGRYDSPFLHQKQADVWALLGILYDGWTLCGAVPYIALMDRYVFDDCDCPHACAMAKWAKQNQNNPDITADDVIHMLLNWINTNEIVF